MLEACADLAERHDLAVYTHVYETKGQALIAREQFADHEGSFIGYLEARRPARPAAQHRARVWITRRDMDRLAEADAASSSTI